MHKVHVSQAMSRISAPGNHHQHEQSASKDERPTSAPDGHRMSDPSDIEMTPHSHSRHSSSTTLAEAQSTSVSTMVPVSKTRQTTVLISAFLTICITIGLNQSYGVFQSVYVSSDSIVEAKPNTALVAFIGTFGAGLTWAGSIFVNPLMTRTKLWHITTPGVILMSLGFGLASLATKTWHLLLTQGFLYGIGSSMLYFPILSVCPEYFGARRGAAMGFVLSGSGIGAVMLSPVIRALIVAVGVRWTLRVLSFLCLFALPIALTAPPSRIANRATHVDLKIARKPAFILSVCAALMQSSGSLIPLTFLSQYSSTLGYTASFGAGLIAVSNGVNSVSRIATGFAGDSFGRQNMLILNIVGSSVAVCWFWLQSAATGSQVFWLLFVVFYGVTGGGYNALFPTTVAEVFGIQAYASVNGFIYFVRGLGSFFGSPVGGAILGESKRENYLNVVYFDTALLFGASLCVIGVRYFDAIEKGHFSLKA